MGRGTDFRSCLIRDVRSPDRSSSDSVSLNFCKRRASCPGVSGCEKMSGLEGEKGHGSRPQATRTSSSSKYFLFSRLYFSTKSWGGFCWTAAGWCGGGGSCWELNCGAAITTSRSTGGPMGVFPDEEARTLMVCGGCWIGGGAGVERGRPRGERTDGGR